MNRRNWFRNVAAFGLGVFAPKVDDGQKTIVLHDVGTIDTLTVHAGGSVGSLGSSTLKLDGNVTYSTK